MSCDLPSKIRELIAVLINKCEECGCNPDGDTPCSGIPVASIDSSCGIEYGAVTDIYNAVQAMITDCGLVETEDDPGAPDGCIDEDYLYALKVYIATLTCGTFEYTPCADQCPDDLPTIYLPDKGDLIIVSYFGTRAYYYKTGLSATSNEATYGASFVEVQTEEECPTLSALKTSELVRHCFHTCCEDGGGFGHQRTVVITNADFDDLFPSEENDFDDPNDELCIVYNDCCYCNHTLVVNPPYPDNVFTASEHTICDDCQPDDGADCECDTLDCTECSDYYAVTLSGFYGLEADVGYAGGLCRPESDVDGVHILQRSTNWAPEATNECLWIKLLGSYRTVQLGIGVDGWYVTVAAWGSWTGDLPDPGSTPVWSVTFGPKPVSACPPSGIWVLDECTDTSTGCDPALCDAKYGFACTVETYP